MHPLVAVFVCNQCFAMGLRRSLFLIKVLLFGNPAFKSGLYANPFDMCMVSGSVVCVEMSISHTQVIAFVFTELV